MADDEHNLLTPEVSENEIDAPEKLGLIDVCIAEIRHLAANALSLKKKIESAKTAPKKKLYEKKLIKNSKKAAEILLYLEHVQVNRAIRNHQEEQQFIDIRNKKDDDEGETSNSTTTRSRSDKEGEEA